MRKFLASTAFAATMAAGTMLAGSARSNAAVLLNLIDPPVGIVDYDLTFTATTTETTISVGGYQVPSYEQVYYNVVSASSGPNLLGGSWSFTPAAEGSLSDTYDDGTPVPALNFGGVAVGFYDTYSQTFATAPGTKYTYSFTFDEDGGPSSGLLVTTTGAVSTIPEASTWAMMLLGFAGLGFVGYRQRQKLAGAASV